MKNHIKDTKRSLKKSIKKAWKEYNDPTIQDKVQWVRARDKWLESVTDFKKVKDNEKKSKFSWLGKGPTEGP